MIDSIDFNAQKLALSLGSMAASILKREAPFNSIPVQLEACSRLFIEYMNHYDDIEEGFRRKLIDTFIKFSQGKIGYLVAGLPSGYNAEDQAILTEFWEWYKAKFKREFEAESAKMDSRSFGGQGKAVVNEFKEAMFCQMPEFSFVKKHPYSGLTGFGKPIENGNILYIYFDLNL